MSHPSHLDAHTTRLSHTTSTRSKSPPPLRAASPLRSTRPGPRTRESSSGLSKEKENAKPVDSTKFSVTAMPASIANGNLENVIEGPRIPKGKGKGKLAEDMVIGGGDYPDTSLEPVVEELDGIVRRRNPPRSAPSDPSPRAKSPFSHVKHPNGNGVATLPTIADPATDDDSLNGFAAVVTPSKPPPPAPSAFLGPDGRPLVARRRRSSSIKRKLSPGVVPTKAVDWEIPRKALHSSIGFLTLLLNYLNPPTLAPLLTVLTAGLVSVTTVDILRLRYAGFAEIWEAWFGFLMRESERNKVNGVIWYLVGVIWVLGIYPRDVAVVSILTLSWSDTTASTIGRLWGRHTPPLPSHVPGIKWLPFAPRKSLAGFLAATVTGSLICLGFWWTGSGGRWSILDGQSWMGLLTTAGVVGIGGAVVEALDLGLDDNLTLPILSGAIIWGWLGLSNAIFG